jgi:flagellar biogenesis protein FliO
MAQSKLIFLNYQEKEEEEVMMNGENIKKKIHPNRKIALLSLAFCLLIIIITIYLVMIIIPYQKKKIIIIKQIIF